MKCSCGAQVAESPCWWCLEAAIMETLGTMLGAAYMSPGRWNRAREYLDSDGYLIDPGGDEVDDD